MKQINLDTKDNDRIPQFVRDQYTLHPRGFFYKIKYRPVWAHYITDGWDYVAWPLADFSEAALDEWPLGVGNTVEEATDSLLFKLEMRLLAQKLSRLARAVEERNSSVPPAE